MGIRWQRSGTVEFDNNGNRAAGCLAKFFEGGTTTPFTVYQDADETTPHAHPLQADANGRWPLVFIPYTTSYDEQVYTSGGTQLSYFQELPNTDPVEASEDSVDPSELIQTGMIIFDPVGGTKDGYVRVNGRTIGNASSGATERANADTEQLFTYYWNGFSNAIAPVSSGRGASAAADYAANKTIQLLGGRSAVLCGVDDMGNSAAGIGYGGSFVTGNATTGGSVGGANTHTLVTGELPSHTHTYGGTVDAIGNHTHGGTTDSGGNHQHTHSGTTGNDNADHTHQTSISHVSGIVALTGGGSNIVLLAEGSGQINGSANYTSGAESAGHQHSFSGTTDLAGTHAHTFTTSGGGSHSHTYSGTTNAAGSGTAHNNMPRFVLGTYFQKL